MNTLDDADLVEIERRITAKMVEVFDIDISELVLDMTNFATYIDSANDRAPIAQRDHAKQKRHDLHLVGLGLIVTRNFGIPLVSHAYASNRPDATQFAQVVTELTDRFGSVGGSSGDLTVVFDASQDSKSNLALIRDSALHFVGSIPPVNIQTCSLSPRRAMAWSTKNVFLESALLRREPMPSEETGGSSSPIRTTSISNRRGGLPKRSPRRPDN